MAGAVLEIQTYFKENRDSEAEWISNTWSDWNSQRSTWLDEVQEARNYIFATDTSTTTNSSLPWRNSTTLPKLCQIRDNLHANYLASLFPNDDWLVWEGRTSDDETRAKREAIQAYMSNKTREGGFRTVASQLLYDYIDYGNCFMDVRYTSESKEDALTGEDIPGYNGPKAVRISPLDIVFNPMATDFHHTPKIIRSLKSIGEIKQEMEDNPDSGWTPDLIERMTEMRSALGGYGEADFYKAESYSVDGFGSIYSYIRQPFVEILEFQGDFHVKETGQIERNMVITVVDRSFVARVQKLPTWLPQGTIQHAGWRFRPDNLWAMSPLANLVGMQYRIDHLENMKADVFDLIAYPPFKITGEVEEFNWGPNEEIHIDEGGNVEMLSPPTQALLADNQIDRLEMRMEEYAGAPRETMGLRTPGEKTAFEVGVLSEGASRIFQEKITNFETELLEPGLNAMLEVSRRNLDTLDTIRVMDEELGTVLFQTVTKEDITASGTLRPIGARHFSQKAKRLQEIGQLLSTPMGQLVTPHISSKELAKLIEEDLGLAKFGLFQPYAQIFEQAEVQRVSQQVQEDMQVEQGAVPPQV